MAKTRKTKAQLEQEKLKRELTKVKKELKKVQELEQKGERKYNGSMIRNLRPELEYKVKVIENKLNKVDE